MAFTLAAVMAGVQACINDSSPSHPLNNFPVMSGGSTPTPATAPTPDCALFEAAHDAPVSAVTPLPLSLGDFVEWGDGLAATCVAGPVTSALNGLEVFAVNASASLPATLEMAVYGETPSTVPLLVADTLVPLPPAASGWYGAALAVTLEGATGLDIVAHALSGNLFIGTTPGSGPQPCSGYTGIDLSYPLASGAIVPASSFTAGPCFQTNLQTLCLSCP